MATLTCRGTILSDRFQWRAFPGKYLQSFGGESNSDAGDRLTIRMNRFDLDNITDPPLWASVVANSITKLECWHDGQWRHAPAARWRVCRPNRLNSLHSQEPGIPRPVLTIAWNPLESPLNISKSMPLRPHPAPSWLQRPSRIRRYSPHGHSSGRSRIRRLRRCTSCGCDA